MLATAWLETTLNGQPRALGMNRIRPREAPDTTKARMRDRKESPPQNLNERAEQIGRVAGPVAVLGVLLSHYYRGGALEIIGQVTTAIGILGILCVLVLSAIHYDKTRRKARTSPSDRKS
jgi:hypothetical protein